jgi:hypothetical protein
MDPAMKEAAAEGRRIFSTLREEHAMTRISTLTLSSLLAIGTTAVAQTETATTMGANESGSSISNPAGIATLPGGNSVPPAQTAAPEAAERVERAEPVEPIPPPPAQPALRDDRDPDARASADLGADASTHSSVGLYGHTNPGLGSPGFQRR